MNRNHIISAIALAVGGLALSACTGLFAETYRFRMTVEVDTPEGIRSGSSVYEVWAENTWKILPDEAGRDWGVRGEAVAVDLPNGQTLFALLQTDLARLSMATLDPAFHNDIVESAKRIAAGQGIKPKAEVSPERTPLLVTFRDIKNPASVERVDPMSLTATFGPGYALHRITIQLTNESVTTGIEERFDWWDAYESKSLDGQRFRNSTAIANNISRRAFSRGIKKGERER